MLSRQRGDLLWRLPWRRRLSPALGGTLAVLRLLPRVSRRLTALLGVGVLASTLLPLSVTVLTGLLVGSIPATVDEGLDSAAGRTTLTLLAGVGFVAVLVRVLGPLESGLAAIFGREVNRHLEARVMAAVGRPSGVAHLEDPAILDLVKNAEGVGTAASRPGDAVGALAALLPSWLTALGSAAILLAFRWWLGLLWLALWPVVLYLLQREYLRVGAVASDQVRAVRRADYFRDLALARPAAKEVRVWGLLDWLLGRFDQAWGAAMGPVWRARRPNRPVVWLCVSTVALANLGAFAMLAWAAVRGDLDLAALAVYTRAVLGAGAFRSSDTVNTILAYAAVSVPSLLDLERRVAAAGQAERPRGAALADLAADAPRRAIRFQRMTFRYPGQATDVLAGLDLDIPAGSSLAIVGANGAGKTTMIKLLCRLHDPTGGAIVVDGVDLRLVDATAWQRRVAAIFQDFVQYHLPARDNVGLGAPELCGDLVRLRAAAEKAGALELIESLPRGWDTVLSRQYTDGVDLSGGQWQRIALARALFAVEGGARVLILDEPAAHMDVRAEAALYDRFLDITTGLTTILISHRFATVRRADRIVVLADSAVIEHGTHEALVALGGRYATMFALQAARFSGKGPAGGAAGHVQADDADGADGADDVEAGDTGLAGGAGADGGGA